MKMTDAEYPQMLKDLLDDQMFALAATYLDAGHPFRIILTPEDTWDKDLPDDIREASQDMMVIDIDGQSLDDSFYNNETDVIHIVTGFDGEAYYRTIDEYDIMGIVDSETGTPIMIKPYDVVRPDEFDEFEDIEEMIEVGEALQHSYETLKELNPQFFK